MSRTMFVIVADAEGEANQVAPQVSRRIEFTNTKSDPEVRTP